MRPVGIRPAGDQAWLIECDSLDSVLAINAYLGAQPLPGQLDVIPAARTLLVRFSTARQTRRAKARLLTIDAPAVARGTGREITIDVIYDGEDLDDVATHTGLSIDEIIAAHTGQRWQAAFGGFAPGFFYMMGENEALSVPRRDSPRTRVPAGAVGLAGVFSAVYPKASPGGWQLIGHTNAALWDIDREPAALLRPGDTVRYRQVEAFDTATVETTDPTKHPVADTPSALLIRAPGLQSLIQDLGRPGLGAMGVSAAGAADQSAARQANRLVGNTADAPVIETVHGGLCVEACGDVVLAHAGAVAQGAIDGPNGARPARSCTPFVLHNEETLTLAAPAHGLRQYLAVRGGFAVAPTLASCARDTLADLGPEPLTAGQRLPIRPSPPGQAVGAPEQAVFEPSETTTLHVILGPRDDWFDAASLARLTSATWQVSDASDRVGLRLALAQDSATETPLTRRITDELPSEGAVAGALQVPPSGTPILFLRDHPVTGGYPVIAVVAHYDIDRAAQLAPGDTLRFAMIESSRHEDAS